MGNNKPSQKKPLSSWTTRRLLSWTTGHLARRGVDNPRLASEMLLSHILGVTRLKLYMDPDRPASALERAAFRDLVERAAEHEPVDYLVGQTPFFSMMIKVTRAVLVPRPSTEALVEHVIQHARRTPGFNSPLIADIGTGSGAIAVTLAKHIRHSRVIAIDSSQAALKVAQENASIHDVDGQIDFRLGNLLEPLAGQRVNYLVSNPPYISDAQWERLPRNVKEYEPVLALRGGVDGLKYLQPLIAHGPCCLRTTGQLVLEIDAPQKHAVLSLAQKSERLIHEHVLADHQGLPRLLIADACGLG